MSDDQKPIIPRYRTLEDIEAELQKHTQNIIPAEESEQPSEAETIEAPYYRPIQQPENINQPLSQPVQNPESNFSDSAPIQNTEPATQPIQDPPIQYSEPPAQNVSDPVQSYVPESTPIPSQDPNPLSVVSQPTADQQPTPTPVDSPTPEPDLSYLDAIPVVEVVNDFKPAYPTMTQDTAPVAVELPQTPVQQPEPPKPTVEYINRPWPKPEEIKNRINGVTEPEKTEVEQPQISLKDSIAAYEEKLYGPLRKDTPNESTPTNFEPQTPPEPEFKIPMLNESETDQLPKESTSVPGSDSIDFPRLNSVSASNDITFNQSQMRHLRRGTEYSLDVSSKTNLTKILVIILVLILIAMIAVAVYFYKPFSLNKLLSKPEPSAEPTLQSSSVASDSAELKSSDIDRSGYTVRIFNGTKKAGLASIVTTKLKELGYQIDKSGNATTSALLQTTVRLKSDNKDLSAQLLKDLSPDFQAIIGSPLKAADTADAEITLGNK